MRVHHLNCVSGCPLGGALTDGASGARLRGRLACHCLLIEAPRGLVLVDTGLGLRDVAAPRPRLSRFFLSFLRPDLRDAMTAVRQIRALGFDPKDVRHIALTSLDFDHAGGLDDFPWATVHLMADEVKHASAQETVLDRMRFRPGQWSTRERWRTYDAQGGERWFGFDCVRDLVDVGGDVLLVPLVGHTRGHAGVAVRRDRAGGLTDWLLMAGDAYLHHGEMLDPPRCPPGLRAYQAMMEKDRTARLANRTRLRLLAAAHGDEVVVTSAHDVVEFERLAGRALEVPAGAPSTGPGRGGRSARAPATTTRGGARRGTSSLNPSA